MYQFFRQIHVWVSQETTDFEIQGLRLGGKLCIHAEEPTTSLLSDPLGLGCGLNQALRLLFPVLILNILRNGFGFYNLMATCILLMLF